MLTQWNSKDQASTCANCPYFQNFNEVSGRGWCDLFDQMARLQHQRTNTCEQEIETRQKEPQKIEPTLQPEAETKDAKSTQWSVTYNVKWQWYDVWVGDRCINRASTYESGERMAQQYIAMNEMIQRQNQAVLAKYAC